MAYPIGYSQTATNRPQSSEFAASTVYLDIREKIDNFDLESLGQRDNDKKGRIPFTALDPSDVGPVTTRSMRKLFLRPATLLA